MNRVIQSRAETKAASEKLHKRLRRLGGKERREEWVFPDGQKLTIPTITIETGTGDIEFGLQRLDSRMAHLFRRVGERQRHPDVEMNIPYSLDRGVSGVYVQAPDGIWLCSRGQFTAYRGKIDSETTLAHFRDWLVEVDDGGMPAEVIPVTSLSSPSIGDDIAAFLDRLAELKKLRKAAQKAGGSVPVKASPGEWRTGEEFEGFKSPVRGGPPGEYEYRHGPICNRLFSALEQSVSARSDLKIGKNRNVDAAVVSVKGDWAKVIFEVKTSTVNGSQIYGGIGQLLVYRQHYGREKTVLALVLPGDASGLAPIEALLKSLGIHLVLAYPNRFATSSGKALDAFVREKTRRLRAS